MTRIKMWIKCLLTRSVIALAMAALLLISSLPLTGCTYSDSQVKADAQAIATACGNIAVVLKATNPDLADKLSMAASALAAAASNYTTGSPAAILQTAADTVEVALSLIPQTAAYAPLVGIAVAAVEVLLANLPSSPSKVSAMSTPRAPNPYLGQARIVHRVLRSPQGDFKAAWNAQAPKLGIATL